MAIVFGIAAWCVLAGIVWRVHVNRSNAKTKGKGMSVSHLKTECCGVPLADDDRFCRKCGYEARAASPSDDGARQPQEDIEAMTDKELEDIKLDAYGRPGFSQARGCDTSQAIRLISEIERQRARIVVLETSVDSLRYLIDHPVTNETTKI